MTSITYRNVFESFLGKVEDYDFVNMNIDDIYEILTDYLHSVVSQHIFVGCLRQLHLMTKCKTLDLRCLILLPLMPIQILL